MVKNKSGKTKGSVKEPRKPREPYIPKAGIKGSRYGCGGKKGK